MGYVIRVIFWVSVSLKHSENLISSIVLSFIALQRFCSVDTFKCWIFYELLDGYHESLA